MQKENSNEIYNFKIIDLIKESFSRTNGVKWKFMGAIIIYLIISFITTIILENTFPENGGSFNNLIAYILSIPVLTPIEIGIEMLGVKHARNESLEFKSILEYFSYLIPIFFTCIAMYFIIVVGFIFLILPGIYLLISYSFTYRLIVDKGLGVFKAMELSRKTITKQWFKFFGLSLLFIFIIIISIIPLGIGLLWSIPTYYIAYGILYHNLFDKE
jgi:uncharacterized membrane protein